MPLNSHAFLLVFLPLVVLVCLVLSKAGRGHWLRGVLALASLGFYAQFSWHNLPVILASLAVNYWLGSGPVKRSRWWLAVGVGFNIAVLGVFKYAGFVLENLEPLLGGLPAVPWVWPVGISFFTFVQIAYLVDTSRGEPTQCGWLDYVLLLGFFPKIIAGPIVRFSELVPQLRAPEALTPRAQDLAAGIFLMSLGLFKKAVLADSLAPWVDRGFAVASQGLTLAEGWVTSLAYTLQIYFDFSGYTDLALGAALLFGIRLPANFLSPYHALGIQDFWRRWHVTLSRFLRDYIYIPLGGNRKGPGRTLTNVMITFLLGGLWHGAGWTFVLWGFLHGAALCIQRLFQKTGLGLPRPLAWLVTFAFVNAAWVFFRAPDINSAWQVIAAMAGAHGAAHGGLLLPNLGQVGITGPAVWALALGACFIGKNSMELTASFSPTRGRLIWGAAMAITGLLCLGDFSPYIYANF